MAVNDISRGRLTQIDALRGLAAFAVFVFHVSGAAGFPKRTLPPLELFGRTWSNIPSVLSFGATGVSLFFVISGFCLALKPLRQGVPSIDVRRYALDRFGRVYPAYFIAVLFSWLVAVLRGIDIPIAEVGVWLLFLHGFIQAWHLTLNGALWSMSTEAQFYVAFPLVFAAFARSRAVVFLTAVVLGVLGFRLLAMALPGADTVIGGLTTKAFLMNTLPGRLLEFGLGIALAGAWVTDRQAVARWCRWLLVPGALFGGWARVYGPAWLPEPALGLLYMVLLGLAVTWRTQLDENNTLVGFGRASYSFFLLHLPIISLFADNVSWLQRLSPYSRFFALLVMAFFATLPLSLLLYRYVELPVWLRFRQGNAGEAAVI